MLQKLPVFCLCWYGDFDAFLGEVCLKIFPKSILQHPCSRSGGHATISRFLHTSHPLVERVRWQGLHDEWGLWTPCRIYDHGVSSPVKSTPPPAWCIHIVGAG